MADRLIAIGFWTVAGAIAAYATAAFVYVFASLDGTVRQPYVLAVTVVIGFLGGLIMAFSACLQSRDAEIQRRKSRRKLRE